MHKKNGYDCCVIPVFVMLCCFLVKNLVEEVAYSDLEFPALAIVVVVVVGLGKIVTVLLVH